MFFFEIVFGFNFRITISQDILKILNDYLDLFASKFGTDPDSKTVNFFHWLALLSNGLSRKPIYKILAK